MNRDEILIAEFEYIANSAFQANEDRSKATSFFIVSVGSLTATIFGAQIGGGAARFSSGLLFSLAGLFLLLTLLGTLTLAQLIRLRRAWREAALALNQIKAFYLERFPELEAALRWRNETLPPLYKPDSLSFYMALEVALVSGMTFAASVFFFQYALRLTALAWPLTALAGLLAFVVQMSFYRRRLRA